MLGALTFVFPVGCEHTTYGLADEASPRDGRARVHDVFRKTSIQFRRLLAHERKFGVELGAMESDLEYG